MMHWKFIVRCSESTVPGHTPTFTHMHTLVLPLLLINIIKAQNVMNGQVLPATPLPGIPADEPYLPSPSHKHTRVLGTLCLQQHSIFVDYLSLLLFIIIYYVWDGEWILLNDDDEFSCFCIYGILPAWWSLPIQCFSLSVLHRKVFVLSLLTKLISQYYQRGAAVLYWNCQCSHSRVFASIDRGHC